MLKYALLAAVCLIAVTARPQGEAPEVTILNSVSETDGAGNFNWASETSDGTKLEQKGYIKNPEADPEEQIQVIQGSYSYIDPEGNTITVTYIADENGFQPTGDHLPTPPPVPEAIQKVVELALKNAAAQQAQQ
ncbi:unnamed protein product [Allacma fusca]|uniref:Uncharacterized protein n=2 Tax=Allacma fusca TaxID=39272 RepID=A0A8J2KTP7_9HEXA|nr:unnamed protein product [Allacma fusca]